MPQRAHQVGALCFRRTGKRTLDILLVTSRDTGRWVIPKGWPENDRGMHRCAAREALEEAGVVGDVGAKPVGQYPYEKREKVGSKLLNVAVYPLQVRRQRRQWPEDGERTRKWFSIGVAADKVDEPELAELMNALAKRVRRGKEPLN